MRAVSSGTAANGWWRSDMGGTPPRGDPCVDGGIIRVSNAARQFASSITLSGSSSPRLPWAFSLRGSSPLVPHSGTEQLHSGPAVHRPLDRLQPLTEHPPRALRSAADELAGGDERADRPAEAGAIVKGATVAGVNGGGCGAAVGTRGG